jgi:hypothetical protein
VNFSDLQLEECYARNFTSVAGFSDEERQVCALIAVHDLFEMLEGPHSARVHETIDHLLSPKLRSGLRDWYRRCGTELNPAAIDFRERLSQLAGEHLEQLEKIEDMPSTHHERQ